MEFNQTFLPSKLPRTSVGTQFSGAQRCNYSAKLLNMWMPAKAISSHIPPHVGKADSGSRHCCVSVSWLRLM
eukprot:5701554-Pyramimonas_sp.AAC.1